MQAKEQGKAYGAAQELDGKGDAKRHILLGWLAKQSPSPRVASLGIKAREFIDPSGRKMDEFNNQLGYTFPDSIQSILKIIDSQDDVGKQFDDHKVLPFHDVKKK